MPRTTIWRTAALLFPAALLLGGCSGDDGDLRVGGATAGNSPTVTPPEAPESDLEPDDESLGPGRLEGDRATAAGVSFDVPDGWETIDPAELADGATEDLEEAADAVGLTPEELQSTMAGADLIVLDGDAEDGEFRDNVNVTSPGGALPSAEEAAAQLEASGGTVGESDTVETDAGEAVTVDYELDAGTGVVQGTVIGVEGADGLVLITVSTLDAGSTDEIASGIIDSLAAAE